MYEYHKGVTSPHPYSSPWYEWPLDIRPIFYYQGQLLPEGMGASIAGFGHPLLFWTGFVAFIATIVMIVANKFRKHAADNENKLLFFPVIGYLSQYVPWIVAPRKLTFIYHYFSCVPFLILMVGILFRWLETNKIVSKKAIRGFLIAYLALFVIYYPVLSGVEVPRLYLDMLRILPRWDW